MRFAAFVAVVCPGLLLLATASAHGPGDVGHAGGGRPNFAGGPGGGNGFKPGKFEGGPGLADKLKAVQNDGDGKSDKHDFAGLHPNAAHALKTAAGNNSSPPLGNLTGQGGGPGLAHHAGELIGFLEMAKN